MDTLVPYGQRPEVVERQRAYRAAHKAKARQASRDWRAANPERRNAVDAAWRDANRERIRERHRKWMRLNADRVRDNTARQRARRRAVPLIGRVSRIEVWERDAGICGLCGIAADPENWHLDHVVPLAKGGVHSTANVQVSHPVCNARKGTSWTS